MVHFGGDFLVKHGPGEVRRKHNTKVSTSLPNWYRDPIDLVVWLSWCTLVFDEGKDQCFVTLKSNLDVKHQLAR